MTAKLTIENDLTTRMTERQPVTSVLQDSGQKSSIETFVLYLKFWLRFKVSNIDPPHRQAVSRCKNFIPNVWFFLQKLMHLNDKKNRVKAKRKYDFRCQTFKEYFVESFTFSANTCIKFV